MVETKFISSLYLALVIGSTHFNLALTPTLDNETVKSPLCYVVADKCFWDNKEPNQGRTIGVAYLAWKRILLPFHAIIRYSWADYDST